MESTGAARRDRPHAAIVRTDASEQIAHELRLYVDRRHLKPGDRLGTETELADEFGVSRATLREAVRLLAGTHLIRSTQGRSGGIFVANTLNGSLGRNMSEVIGAMIANKSVSLHTLVEARGLLEVSVAGLAAERADRASLQALEMSLDRLKAADPMSDAFGEADIDFHETIALMAGNDLMVSFSTWTLDVLVPSLSQQLRPIMDPATIIEQHGAVLSSIKRQDRGAAERWMRQHMDYIQEMVVQIELAP